MLAAFSVVLALGSGSAEPDPPTSVPAADYDLTWVAPAACPDAEAIEAAVAALTTGRPEGTGTLEIEGHVSQVDGGFALRLRTSLRGEVGTRELSAAVCHDLADSVALVVAVSLDPALADAGSVPEPTPEPEPEPESRAPSSSPSLEPTARPEGERTAEGERTGHASRDRAPADPPRRSRRAPPGLLLRGGLGPELGALPGLTAALRASVGIAWPRVRVLVAATYLAPRRASAPGGTAALYQQGAVALLGCGRFERGPWSVPLCAGLEAGGLRADGRGLRTPRTVVGPWLGPLARVGVVRALRRVGLWVDLEGVARGVGTRVVVDEMLAFRPDVGSLRLLAGFEITWR